MADPIQPARPTAACGRSVFFDDYENTHVNRRTGCVSLDWPLSMVDAAATAPFSVGFSYDEGGLPASQLPGATQTIGVHFRLYGDEEVQKIPAYECNDPAAGQPYNTCAVWVVLDGDAPRLFVRSPDIGSGKYLVPYDGGHPQLDLDNDGNVDPLRPPSYLHAHHLEAVRVDGAREWRLTADNKVVSTFRAADPSLPDAQQTRFLLAQRVVFGGPAGTALPDTLVSFVRDAAGRLDHVDFARFPGKSVSFTYANGKLTQLTDGINGLGFQFQYDAAGQLSTVVSPEMYGPNTGFWLFEVGYPAAGNIPERPNLLRELNYPDSSSIEYLRTLDGWRVDQVQQATSASAMLRQTQLGYCTAQNGTHTTTIQRFNDETLITGYDADQASKVYEETDLGLRSSVILNKTRAQPGLGLPSDVNVCKDTAANAQAGQSCLATLTSQNMGGTYQYGLLGKLENPQANPYADWGTVKRVARKRGENEGDVTYLISQARVANSGQTHSFVQGWTSEGLAYVQTFDDLRRPVLTRGPEGADIEVSYASCFVWNDEGFCPQSELSVNSQNQLDAIPLVDANNNPVDRLTLAPRWRTIVKVAGKVEEVFTHPATYDNQVFVATGDWTLGTHLGSMGDVMLSWEKREDLRGRGHVQAMSNGEENRRYVATATDAGGRWTHFEGVLIDSGEGAVDVAQTFSAHGLLTSYSTHEGYSVAFHGDSFGGLLGTTVNDEFEDRTVLGSDGLPESELFGTAVVRSWTPEATDVDGPFCPIL